MSGGQGSDNTQSRPLIPDERGEPDCPVCLSRVQERAYTDSCLHEFCYGCIHEWSRTHNKCPVCRTVYTRILHNIRSKDDYDMEAVDAPLDPRNGMILQLGGVVIIMTPQDSPMYVINPVTTRLGRVRHNVIFLGPNQTYILRHMSPNMLLVTPERFEDTMREMNAQPHYPHHGRHPRFRHRSHARDRSPVR